MQRRTILQMMAALPLISVPKFSQAATKDLPLWMNFSTYGVSNVFMYFYSKPNCRGWLFGGKDVELAGGVREYLSKLESRGAPREYQGGLLGMRQATSSLSGMENFLIEQGFESGDGPTQRFCRFYFKKFKTVDVRVLASGELMTWFFFDPRPSINGYKEPLLTVRDTWRHGT